MIITRATEYSIRAILYMACQPQGEVIFKKDICRAQEITPAFLTVITSYSIHYTKLYDAQ